MSFGRGKPLPGTSVFPPHWRPPWITEDEEVDDDDESYYFPPMMELKEEKDDHRYWITTPQRLKTIEILLSPWFVRRLAPHRYKLSIDFIRMLREMLIDCSPPCRNNRDQDDSDTDSRNCKKGAACIICRVCVDCFDSFSDDGCYGCCPREEKN